MLFFLLKANIVVDISEIYKIYHIFNMFTLSL